MILFVRCRTCGNGVQAESQLLGHEIPCPACHSKIIVSIQCQNCSYIMTMLSENCHKCGCTTGVSLKAQVSKEAMPTTVLHSQMRNFNSSNENNTSIKIENLHNNNSDAFRTSFSETETDNSRIIFINWQGREIKIKEKQGIFFVSVEIFIDEELIQRMKNIFVFGKTDAMFEHRQEYREIFYERTTKNCTVSIQDKILYEGSNFFANQNKKMQTKLLLGFVFAFFILVISSFGVFLSERYPTGKFSDIIFDRYLECRSGGFHETYSALKSFKSLFGPYAQFAFGAGEAYVGYEVRQRKETLRQQMVKSVGVYVPRSWVTQVQISSCSNIEKNIHRSDGFAVKSVLFYSRLLR